MTLLGYIDSLPLFASNTISENSNPRAGLQNEGSFCLPAGLGAGELQNGQIISLKIQLNGILVMFRITLGRIDLTTVSLPIYEYIISLHLCRSF